MLLQVPPFSPLRLEGTFNPATKRMRQDLRFKLLSNKRRFLPYGLILKGAPKISWQLPVATAEGREAAAKEISSLIQQSAPESKNQKKVQPTLQEALDRKKAWEPTDAQALLHCQKLAEFLAVSMKPFSMVEDPAFLRFMHYCVPKWKIPGRKHFASSVVPALEAAIREALKKELKLSIGGIVHLTTDIWSSRQVTDYMSVTAHWMIQDQQGCLSRRKAVMDMASFGQTHTAENIAEKLDSVVKRWLPPLDLEPGYVTTDNAQNVVRALRDVNMKRIPCMAHCLNLVVKGGLSKAGPAVEDALKTSRAICGHFHHSATKMSKLAEIQRRQNLPQHQLLQDVPTRWNSTLYMVERLCEQRRAVTEFFEDSSKHHLTPEQWMLLKTLITVLRPFEEATRLVCMDDATLGQVLPLLKFIERSLERMASREGAAGTAQLAASLLTALHSNRHLNSIKEDIVYWAASFLDPRFRNTFGNYTEDQAALKLKRTQEHLIRQIEETMDAKDDCITTETSSQMSAQPCSTSVQTVTPPPAGEFSLWFSSSDEMGLTQSQVRPEHAPPQPSLAAKVELDAYAQDRDADSYGVKSDPLQYWATKKNQWPSLFVTAVKHLACPPTSVYSEQAFSAAGMIVTERRNRLSTKNVSMLAFIRMNRAWIDKAASPITSMLEQDLVSSESDNEDEEPLLKRVHFEDT
ncbi:zinc finger BED domain-containing protein 4-like [Ixodes scapularis]|uniref:zinc finger BED domain-containing protein 4-like n=1 Tax=Ixodes scapularis TaxID=6945 RepID=UPI001A9FC283|nr:zinc finger BED domain-containing protein 4-like [Ixodes scapularis]